MRILPLLAGLMLIGLPALGDDQDKQEIRRLQERLDLVESKLAVLLAAQEPPAQIHNVAPAPAPVTEVRPEVIPPDLLPEIGKIGGQIGFILSGSSNPFHLNNGQDVAGFLDLPLFDPKALHGKIGYEIRLGLSQSKTKFPTTSVVTQSTTLTETNAKVLEIIPFSLKYTATSLERFRLRPYAVLGFGMFVTLHRQIAVGGASLVAGQISQSPELTARGLPIGTGNIDFGIHTGAGLEFRLNRNVSLGFDSRFNRISGGQNLSTYGTTLGFHF